MAERDDARSLIEDARQTVEVELPGFREIADPETGTSLERGLLPRDEVGMVLEPGDDDLVTGTNVGATPGRRHEIQRLRCPAREDQRCRIANAEEPRCPLARRMVSIRRAHGEPVCPAMRVRVVLLVIGPQGIEHGTWLLRRSRGVEIRQRWVRREEREVRARRERHDAFRGPTNTCPSRTA